MTTRTAYACLWAASLVCNVLVIAWSLVAGAPLYAAAHLAMAGLVLVLAPERNGRRAFDSRVLVAWGFLLFVVAFWCGVAWLLVRWLA